MAKKKTRKQQMTELTQTLSDTTADLLDLVKEEMNEKKLDFSKWEVLYIQQGELQYTLTGEGPPRYDSSELAEEYERYCRRFKTNSASISAACEGEFCTQCREPAGHKLSEEILFDDPRAQDESHNLTAYVCCRHFKRLVGVANCVHELPLSK